MAGRFDSAFADLYRAQYSTVLAFILRRVDEPETARDLAADTFRVAWQRAAVERTADRAWLLGIARNLVGDEYRRRRREKLRGEELESIAAAGGATGAEVPAVRDAVERLPETHREVLILTYWDDLDAAEVAQLLQISRSAVWVRLHRARKAFASAWADAPHSHYLAART